MLAILAIVAAIVLFVVLFLSLYPPFGGKASKAKVERFRKSPQYAGGKFVNEVPTPQDMSLRNIASMLKDYAKGNPNVRPRSVLPMEGAGGQPGERPRVTWFGHSALLLELDGKRLLLDPMFGKAPTPFPGIGGNKRYSGKLPFEPERLPYVDAVLLSHDHYDHLDYGTIRKLKDKVGRFIAPLGVGSHLERWGVKPDRIEEHDWWEEFEFEGLRLACTPARHFSGRSLTDRDATLWSSWVIEGGSARIFFSGDSGYGPHFKAIGEKYGPFDLTIMECGQYDERWAGIHMMPEQTVQAHQDVKGKTLLPVHWSAFTLAFHDWDEPAERVTEAARTKGVEVATPQLGEAFAVGGGYPASRWWKGLKGKGSISAASRPGSSFN